MRSPCPEGHQVLHTSLARPLPWGYLVALAKSWARVCIIDIMPMLRLPSYRLAPSAASSNNIAHSAFTGRTGTICGYIAMCFSFPPPAPTGRPATVLLIKHVPAVTHTYLRHPGHPPAPPAGPPPSCRPARPPPGRGRPGTPPPAPDPQTAPRRPGGGGGGTKSI